MDCAAVFGLPGNARLAGRILGYGANGWRWIDRGVKRGGVGSLEAAGLAICGSRGGLWVLVGRGCNAA